MNQNDINLVDDYSNFMESYVDSDLEHHGVKHQKHGVRNYQYKDGSLTPLGRIHYGVGPPRGEGKAESPDDPESPRMKKLASEFNKRRAAAAAGIRRVADDYKERRAKAKAAAEAKRAESAKAKRARDVKEMTRTPDDLVKNRDKLTDEEFKAAVDKFEKLKKLNAENAALLNKYNGLKDESPKEESDDDKVVYPILGERLRNPDGTLTEAGKQREPEARAEQVAKWTKTAEDLVKNRDKLTDEEFKQAVIRFDRERTKKAENEAILKAFGSGNDYEARRQARSAEKIAKAYQKYNAKELIKHKGEFTKEEFDQLKVLVASKSTSDLKKLTTYLSADEYQTALDRYAKTEGARKGQVVQDIRNAGSNVKSIVDMIDQGYKVADNASKMTTGRSIQDLAKNATGTAFMSLLEKADLDTALSRAKATKAASDSAEAVVNGVGDVLKRAKNMTDKEYAEAMSPYYDDVMDILAGNSGGKNDKKNNKGDKNQNPQNNTTTQQQQNKNDKKDAQNKEPFPTYQDQKGSSNAQKQTQSTSTPKKEKQQETKTTQTASKSKEDEELAKSFEGMNLDKPTLYLFGHYKAPTLSFDDPEPPKQQTKKEKKKTTTTKTDDPFAGIDLSKPSINFGSNNTEKASKLSFDSPKSTKKESEASKTNKDYYIPNLTFGNETVSAPKVKPMTNDEYNAVMSKLANDIADFQRKTSTDYKPNVTVDDVYDEVMRKLRG